MVTRHTVHLVYTETEFLSLKQTSAVIKQSIKLAKGEFISFTVNSRNLTIQFLKYVNQSDLIKTSGFTTYQFCELKRIILRWMTFAIHIPRHHIVQLHFQKNALVSELITVNFMFTLTMHKISTNLNINHSATNKKENNDYLENNYCNVFTQRLKHCLNDNPDRDLSLFS